METGVLLAVPMGVIIAVMADMLRHPDQVGVVSWVGLTVSGGAIALYLGLLVWDRR